MTVFKPRPAPERLLNALDRHLVFALDRLSSVALTGHVMREPGLLVITDRSGHRSPFFNAALRTPDGGRPIASVLDRAEDRINFPHHSGILWLREHADTDLDRLAEYFGWTPFAAPEGWPGMVLTEMPDEPLAGAGVRLGRVSEPAGVAAFNKVVQAAYGLPEAVVAARFPATGDWYRAALTAFGAWVDGEPVACSLSVHTGEVAGVYFVGTVPQVRCRGLGRLVTLAAASAGFRAGARVVTLQGTPAGERLYRSLGFVEVTRYRFRAQP